MIGMHGSTRPENWPKSGCRPGDATSRRSRHACGERVGPSVPASPAGSAENPRGFRDTQPTNAPECGKRSQPGGRLFDQFRETHQGPAMGSEPSQHTTRGDTTAGNGRDATQITSLKRHIRTTASELGKIPRALPQRLRRVCNNGFQTK